MILHSVTYKKTYSHYFLTSFAAMWRAPWLSAIVLVAAAPLIQPGILAHGHLKKIKGKKKNVFLTLFPRRLWSRNRAVFLSVAANLLLTIIKQPFLRKFFRVLHRRQRPFSRRLLDSRHYSQRAGLRLGGSWTPSQNIA